MVALEGGVDLYTYTENFDYQGVRFRPPPPKRAVREPFDPPNRRPVNERLPPGESPSYRGKDIMVRGIASRVGGGVTIGV